MNSRLAFHMMFLLLLLLPVTVLAGPYAPNGTLTFKRGPFAGKTIKYGDGSGEYTRVADFTVAELLDFIAGKKNPPRGRQGEVDSLLFAIKRRDRLFFNQLAKEGYDQYAELIRKCFEDGGKIDTGITCRHTASIPIGIDIRGGKTVPVKEYMIDEERGYWILKPGWTL